jgi:uncharacterized membrane protein YhdT
MLHALVDRPWKSILWFVLVAALAYFPSALLLTYYRDDWYYAYDALVGPNGVFRIMFAIDRPARGPFFEIYQFLFGLKPLPYQLAMFFWRTAGGMALVWLFSLLWPRRRAAALAAGLLFALYPGFTWWVSGIEYQPMVASAALMVLSLALTIQAMRLGRLYLQAACVAGAVLTGWIYLSLVEYAAGMEILRLGMVYLAATSPDMPAFGQRAKAALRRWLVYLIIPAGFAVWRFLIFTSDRRATDLGTQLGRLLADPISTGVRWLMNLLLSVVNVAFSAWVQPLMNNFFSGTLREQLLGLLLAVVAGAAAWLLIRWAAEKSNGAAGAPDWEMQAIWLGLAGILLGIAPIIVVNRQITFPSFSHYALPASLGVAIGVVGLVSLISRPVTRAVVFSLLVLASALTHQGLGASALREERTVAAFWHQMAWRAPSIAEGTNILAYMPNLDYGSDSDVVWGPANYIYYPGAQSALPVRVPIAALTPDRGTLNAVLMGRAPYDSTYRAHTVTIDHGRVLIAVQSAADSCVRILDARWPTFSLADSPALRALAFASQAELIQTAPKAGVPPAALFGAEPEHGWCFYFAKASLASQRTDWEDVTAIQGEVDRLGLHPNDQIEWMPFLQAQAYLGDLRAVKEIATRINTEKLYRQQACLNLGAMAEYGFPLPAEAQSYVNELFCGGGQ